MIRSYSLLAFGILLSTLVYSQNVVSGYRIDGQITGLPTGFTVYLIGKPDSRGSSTVVDSVVSQNGKFMFAGKIALEGELYSLRLDTAINKKSKGIYMVNSHIKLTGDYDNWPDGITIKGSPPTTDYEKNQRILSSLRADYMSLLSDVKKVGLKIDSVREGKITKEDTVSLKQQLIALQQRQKEALPAYYRTWNQLIDENPNSLYTPRFIMKNTTMSLDDKEVAYRKLTDRSRNSFYGQELKREIENQRAFSSIKVGAPAPNFVSITPAGETLSLREFVSKGKLTLVDFWGSWCKPCRAQTPYIRKAYDAFHAKGFNVLGVSLEFNRAAWLKAIKDDQLPWAVVSQIKGREEVAAKIYNIIGVPSYLLIDQAGNIVALDLPGSKIPSTEGSLRREELYEIVSRLLGDVKGVSSNIHTLGEDNKPH